jgi:uncharacterized protein YcbX
MRASVAWISVAPVKGLGLVHPEAVELGEGGVAANRAFYLVDERGQMVNGKRLGTLVTVVPAYEPELESLSLVFPDGSAVAGHVATGERVTTSFFGRPVPGHLVEGPWSKALSAYFERPLALVKVARDGDGVDRGTKAAVSLLSTASLGRLSAALGMGASLDHRRFRMLFGVAGVAPHAEDTWLGRQVRLGTAAVVVRGLAGRCVVTSQDPGTGMPDLDTLGALRSYRRQPAGGERLPFGVWGEVVQPGRVALDDTVEPE